MEPVREHLRLLSLFHYVIGGIGYLVSLIPCIHLALGIFFLVAPEELFQVPPPPSVGVAPGTENESIPKNQTPQVVPFPSKLFGMIFVSVASFVILAGMIFSTCLVVAGKRIAALRSHTYCLVIAGMECFLMPIGTVLGIFTILTLIKPEARRLFGLSESGMTPAEG